MASEKMGLSQATVSREELLTRAAALLQSAAAVLSRLKLLSRLRLRQGYLRNGPDTSWALGGTCPVLHPRPVCMFVFHVNHRTMESRRMSQGSRKTEPVASSESSDLVQRAQTGSDRLIVLWLWSESSVANGSLRLFPGPSHALPTPALQHHELTSLIGGLALQVTLEGCWSFSLDSRV